MLYLYILSVSRSNRPAFQLSLCRALAPIAVARKVLADPHWLTPDFFRRSLVCCLHWDAILLFHELECPWMAYIVSD